jgi:hypothetical protein
VLHDEDQQRAVAASRAGAMLLREVSMARIVAIGPCQATAVFPSSENARDDRALRPRSGLCMNR